MHVVFECTVGSSVVFVTATCSADADVDELWQVGFRELLKLVANAEVNVESRTYTDEEFKCGYGKRTYDSD